MAMINNYIKKGSINSKDGIVFNTMVTAANCFGKIYKERGIRKGGIPHPKEEGKLIWFPKLYPNENWINSISNDDNYIFEKNSDDKKAIKHIGDTKITRHNRIVFVGESKNLYRFKGEYELDYEKKTYENGLVWRRISKSVKTYSPN